MREESQTGGKNWLRSWITRGEDYLDSSGGLSRLSGLSSAARLVLLRGETKNNLSSDDVVGDNGNDTEPLEVTVILANILRLGEEEVAVSRGDVVHLATIAENGSRTDQAHESDETEDQVEIGDARVASSDAKEARDTEDEEVNRETAHASRTESEENSSSKKENSDDDTSNTTVLSRAEVEVVTAGEKAEKKDNCKANKSDGGVARLLEACEIVSHCY